MFAGQSFKSFLLVEVIVWWTTCVRGLLSRLYSKVHCCPVERNIQSRFLPFQRMLFRIPPGVEWCFTISVRLKEDSWLKLWNLKVCELHQWCNIGNGFSYITILEISTCLCNRIYFIFLASYIYLFLLNVLNLLATHLKLWQSSFYKMALNCNVEYSQIYATGMGQLATANSLRPICHGQLSMANSLWNNSSQDNLMTQFNYSK